MARPRILIAGGGFCGTLLALHILARSDGPEVLLVDRTGLFGPGVAYGADEPDHLLNVRAGAMGAYPDQPQHFLDWLRSLGGQPDADASDFVPRRVYGRYLRDLLHEASHGPEGLRLITLADEITSIRRTADGVTARLRRVGQVGADAAVLALGTLPPAAPLPPHSLALTDGHFIADPWARDVLARIRRDDSVFMIGTGLTMADVVLSLQRQGHHGQLTALSRRGLLPRAHVEGPESPEDSPPLAGELSAMLKTFRAPIRAGADWRRRFDAQRPLSQKQWATLSEPQQRRFLRHLRPYWEVHRHRLAPGVFSRIDALRRGGKLQILAGRLLGATPQDGAIALTWRRRGSRMLVEKHARWLINCAGPEADVARSPEPLLRQLVSDGLARPNALGLGLDTDEGDQVVGSDGHADIRLTAVGALTRARLWQLTAAPDLRLQVAGLADRLLDGLERRERVGGILRQGYGT